MSRLEDVAYKPATNTAVVPSAANGIGTVTIPAPAAGQRIYICGYTLSYNLAVATAHVPDIVSGALVVERMQVLVGTVLPLNADFAKGVECPAATSCVITCPAAGASVVSTFVVRYFIA